MTNITLCRNRQQLPERIRCLYASMATAPDERRNPIICRNWPGETRQQILLRILKETEIHRGWHRNHEMMEVA